MISTLNRQVADLFVGAFILIAALGVIFVALRTANITDISTADAYVVNIQFDNIGGLKERSPVKSSGVRVGKVKSIVYDNEEHIAVVQIVIGGIHQFPNDSIFSIVSSNLLGGQYIAIDVGGEDENFQNNSVVQGNSAIVLEDLISRFLFDSSGE